MIPIRNSRSSICDQVRIFKIFQNSKIEIMQYTFTWSQESKYDISDLQLATFGAFSGLGCGAHGLFLTRIVRVTEETIIYYLFNYYLL